jgi:hypothetical protein
MVFTNFLFIFHLLAIQNKKYFNNNSKLYLFQNNIYIEKNDTNDINNINYTNIIQYSSMQNYSINIPNNKGYDMRYPYSVEENLDIMYCIKQNFYKKNILDYLESNSSVNNKLLVIEEYNKNNINNKYVVNLCSGNLYKDWNFIM